MLLELYVVIKLLVVIKCKWSQATKNLSLVLCDYLQPSVSVTGITGDIRNIIFTCRLLVKGLSECM